MGRGYPSSAYVSDNVKANGIVSKL